MSRYEFKVVVSGVELSEEQQKRIGQSVSQAGATTIAQYIEKGDPVCVPVNLKHVWCGLPAPDLLQELESFAAKEVGLREGP